MSRSSHHALTGLFALLSGALGCEPLSLQERNENAPITEQARASLSAETDAVHMLGVSTATRELWHTIRYPNGAWDPLGNVLAQAGDLGEMAGVDSAYSNGLLFVAASVRFGDWWLALRFDHGQWTSWAPLNNSSSLVNVGLARASNGDVHFCGEGSELLAHGTWKSATGFGGFNRLPIQRPSGFMVGVDCVAVGEDLLYAVAVHPGTGAAFQLATAVRRADGTWLNFQQTHTLPASETVIRDLNLEASGDTLHMLVTTGETQFHAMKIAGGAWSALGNVESVAGDPGQLGSPAVAAGALAAVGTDLHVLQSAFGGVPGSVRLMHTIRSASGGWTAFANVEAAVPGGFPSGTLGNVSLSRSRNN